MSRMAPPQADAAYVALPQHPDAAYAGHPVVPTALGDEAEDDDGELLPTTPLSLDRRIRWIMFMLGAAVLLPWNGTYFLYAICRRALNLEDSHDHCNTLLPIPGVFRSEVELRIVYFDYVYCVQLCVSCTGYGIVQAGPSSHWSFANRSSHALVRYQTSSELDSLLLYCLHLYSFFTSRHTSPSPHPSSLS
jgi:hypothetical protein